MNSGPDGFLYGSVNLNAMPQPVGTARIQPGDTWHFQAWHRHASGHHSQPAKSQLGSLIP